MMHFYCLFLINFAFGALNYSPERIAELADEFEAEFPGSVEWLEEWAIAEYHLDKMRDLFKGEKMKLPIKNFSSRFAVATSFFIASTNPEMSLVEYAGHVTRILGIKPTGSSFVTDSYYTAKNSLRIPDWFYNHLLLCKAARMSKTDTYSSLYEQVARMRAGGAIRPDDGRFNKGDGKIRGLAHIWNKFGFQRHGEDIPAYLDPDTIEWVFKPNVQKEALQYMTLSFLAPQTDIPVV